MQSNAVADMQKQNIADSFWKPLNLQKDPQPHPVVS